jgi:hypothetical protein
MISTLRNCKLSKKLRFTSTCYRKISNADWRIAQCAVLAINLLISSNDHTSIS